MIFIHLFLTPSQQRIVEVLHAEDGPDPQRRRMRRGGALLEPEAADGGPHRGAELPRLIKKHFTAMKNKKSKRAQYRDHDERNERRKGSHVLSEYSKSHLGELSIKLYFLYHKQIF